MCLAFQVKGASSLDQWTGGRAGRTGASPTTQTRPAAAYGGAVDEDLLDLAGSGGMARRSLSDPFPDLLLLPRVPHRRRTSAAIEATTAACRRNEAEENLLVRREEETYG